MHYNIGLYISSHYSETYRNMTCGCGADRTGSRQGPEEEETGASSVDWSETAYNMVNAVIYENLGSTCKRGKLLY
jgi:hypothetical protein